MFVLMSKKATAANPPPPPAISAAQSSSRTQNACDACRIRKSKCDGHTPCGRCRAKQLVCTSSRRIAKVSGPVTEEHLAILQKQQRRLTRAIYNMADVIKRAESQGFSEGGSFPACHAESELPPFELTDVLQRFAPESQMEETTTSPLDELPLPSKKRRLQDNTLPIQPPQDVAMNDIAPTQTKVDGHDPFQRFLSTVQQHSGFNFNPAATSFQPGLGGFETEQPQAMLTAQPQTASYAEPIGDPGLDFHPQLAPFMDMVDWDASLQHFLDSQYNEDSLNWGADSIGVSPQNNW